MIIGKNSIWKMAVLFIAALLFVLNIVSVVNVVKAAYSTEALTYYWSGVLVSIDCLVVIGVIAMLAYDLYTKWSKDSGKKYNK